MDEKNSNSEEEKNEKMTKEEYLRGEPDYVEPSEDLPSSFLSEENQADQINLVFIPNYKPNISLILDNYIEEIVQAKTRSELKDKLYQVFEHGASQGALIDRIEKLQMEIEDVQASYDAMTKDYGD